MHNFITRPMASKTKSLAVLELERTYRLLEVKERRALKARQLERALDLQTVKKIVFRQIQNAK